jgi:protein ImuA
VLHIEGPEMLRVLRRRIEEIESCQRPRTRSRVSTGVAALDALLPDGGLRRGVLVELLSATDGAGAWTLGLALARQACGEHRVLVVVDEHAGFYPLAASRFGIDLSRCLVVRPTGWRDAYAAICQSLLCGAVGGVIAGCGRVGTVDYQRLRLAAERGGGLGFLVRPQEALRSPACATARLLVSPIASGQPARRLRVEVLRGRGRGQALSLEVDDETGDVHPLPSVARPASLARVAQPSG